MLTFEPLRRNGLITTHSPEIILNSGRSIVDKSRGLPGQHMKSPRTPQMPLTITPHIYSSPIPPELGHSSSPNLILPRDPRDPKLVSDPRDMHIKYKAFVEKKKDGCIGYSFLPSSQNAPVKVSRDPARSNPVTQDQAQAFSSPVSSLPKRHDDASSLHMTGMTSNKEDQNKSRLARNSANPNSTDCSKFYETREAALLNRCLRQVPSTIVSTKTGQRQVESMLRKEYRQVPAVTNFHLAEGRKRESLPLRTMPHLSCPTITTPRTPLKATPSSMQVTKGSLPRKTPEPQSPDLAGNHTPVICTSIGNVGNLRVSSQSSSVIRNFPKGARPETQDVAMVQSGTWYKERAGSIAVPSSDDYCRSLRHSPSNPKCDWKVKTDYTGGLTVQSTPRSYSHDLPIVKITTTRAPQVATINHDRTFDSASIASSSHDSHSHEIERPTSATSGRRHSKSSHPNQFPTTMPLQVTYTQSGQLATGQCQSRVTKSLETSRDRQLSSTAYDSVDCVRSLREKPTSIETESRPRFDRTAYESRAGPSEAHSRLQKETLSAGLSPRYPRTSFIDETVTSRNVPERKSPKQATYSPHEASVDIHEDVNLSFKQTESNLGRYVSHPLSRQVGPAVGHQSRQQKKDTTRTELSLCRVELRELKERCRLFEEEKKRLEAEQQSKHNAMMNFQLLLKTSSEQHEATVQHFINQLEAKTQAIEQIVQQRNQALSRLERAVKNQSTLSAKNEEMKSEIEKLQHMIADLGKRSFASDVSTQATAGQLSTKVHCAINQPGSNSSTSPRKSQFDVDFGKACSDQEKKTQSGKPDNGPVNLGGKQTHHKAVGSSAAAECPWIATFYELIPNNQDSLSRLYEHLQSMPDHHAQLSDDEFVPLKVRDLKTLVEGWHDLEKKRKQELAKLQVGHSERGKQLAEMFHENKRLQLQNEELRHECCRLFKHSFQRHKQLKERQLEMSLRAKQGGNGSLDSAKFGLLDHVAFESFDSRLSGSLSHGTEQPFSSVTTEGCGTAAFTGGEMESELTDESKAFSNQRTQSRENDLMTYVGAEQRQEEQQMQDNFDAMQQLVSSTLHQSSRNDDTKRTRQSSSGFKTHQSKPQLNYSFEKDALKERAIKIFGKRKRFDRRPDETSSPRPNNTLGILLHKLSELRMGIESMMQFHYFFLNQQISQIKIFSQFSECLHVIFHEKDVDIKTRLVSPVIALLQDTTAYIVEMILDSDISGLIDQRPGGSQPDKTFRRERCQVSPRSKRDQTS